MKTFSVDLNNQEILNNPVWSENRPYLNCYIPGRDPRLIMDGKRPAIIMLSGGGFDHLSNRETEPTVLRFVSAGAAGFVLHYSLIPHRFPTQLLEAAKSVKYVRDHAKELGIDPHKVIICGLSVGGHPSACLALYGSHSIVTDELGCDCTPDGQILCYPLLSMGEYCKPKTRLALLGENSDNKELLEFTALYKKVHKDVPPAFIWHSTEDESIPVENSFLYAQALHQHGVKCELHIYPTGIHGLGLAEDVSAMDDDYINPTCAEWSSAAIRWMKREFDLWTKQKKMKI